jgi:hypothetical protein
MLNELTTQDTSSQDVSVRSAVEIDPVSKGSKGFIQ